MDIEKVWMESSMDRDLRIVMERFLIFEIGPDFDFDF